MFLEFSLCYLLVTSLIFQGNESAPLATSELTPAVATEAVQLSPAEVPVAPMASSSHSSPSLEVQQILHSHNSK